jgi:hypothetical protein
LNDAPKFLPTYPSAGPSDGGGWATANLLLGKTSPAGRLPVTWATRLQDYPATDPRYPERSAAGVEHKTTYTEGVNVGYRWFDHEGIRPLFPFGQGLSYTKFAYSALKIGRAADGGLDVSLQIENTGKVTGDEGQDELRSFLKVCEAIRVHVKGLLRANLASWALGHDEAAR